jgi:hypothetical protein
MRISHFYFLDFYVWAKFAAFSMNAAVLSLKTLHFVEKNQMAGK